MAGVMDFLSGMVLTILPLLSVIALWITSLYDQRAANVVYKLHLLRVGLTNMIFSTDRKWGKQADADSIGSNVEDSKEMIFIR